jgi:hypothetical protein
MEICRSRFSVLDSRFVFTFLVCSAFAVRRSRWDAQAVAFSHRVELEPEHEQSSEKHRSRNIEAPASVKA